MRELVFVYLFACLLNIVCVECQSGDSNYTIPRVTLTDCKTGVDDVFHEYYDSTKLRCVPCAQNSTIQTVTADGLSCTCRGNYRREGGQLRPWQWTCVPCEEGEVSSADGWECVECRPPVATGSETCQQCVDQISVERDETGLPVMDGNVTVSTCVSCVNLTQPDAENSRCELCSSRVQLGEDLTLGCACPGVTEGGLCFRRPTDIVLQAKFEIDFEVAGTDTGTETVTSEILVNHLRAAHGACVNHTIAEPVVRDTSEYSNLTACQLLGNLCVLTLYTAEVQPPPGQPPIVPPDACLLHRSLAYTSLEPSFLNFPVHNPGWRALVNGIDEWRSAMPWLYYPQNTAEIITKDTTIPTQYTPGARLNFTLAQYNLTGSFLGWFKGKGASLQLCQNEDSVLDKALLFGSKYKKSCSIPVDWLYDEDYYETLFQDLFLQMTMNGQDQLYAVPIVIENYKDEDGRTPNTGSDRSTWQLAHRYMLVDREAGKSFGATPAVRARVLRYAQTMRLEIRLQDDTTGGEIYPPLLHVSYGTVTQDMYGVNDSVQVTFEVDYKMDVSSEARDVSIAVGVLSAVALVYAGFMANTANKRSGKIAIDFVTLLNMLYFLCATLADFFFAVILGFSIWWWLLYKFQSVFFMVPDTDMDFYVEAYLGAAFALKFIHLVALIGIQVNVDLFFIDWERPVGTVRRERHAPPSARAHQQGGATNTTVDETMPVSCWRTNFMANEWNELAVVRRVSPVLHMLLVILLLHVVGLEDWARYDTSTAVGGADHSTEYSVVFRFAVMAVVYILVGVAQWLFHLLVLSRFWEHPVVTFVDLCSNTNISVFVRTHNNFGYYIHGRNPHGHADVGLRQMHKYMAREAENLCGQRGLSPQSDDQTFEVAIPTNMRRDYERVMLTVNYRSPAPAGGNPNRRLNTDQEKRLQAYTVLNRYLTNFIDQNLPGLQYRIVDKSIWERILDTEFPDIRDVPDTGYFFTDYGHSFDKTLFYGHEGTLQIFEILFFTMVDFIFQDFVLAAIATYGIDVLIVWARKELGKRNIANKTMVDERFLI